jgi:hypothetical protein
MSTELASMVRTLVACLRNATIYIVIQIS